MKPAHLVVKRFGGIRPLARALGIDHSAVHRWTTDKPKGTGGLVPSRHHLPLLKISAERGIDLTATDLVIGD